MKIGGPGCVPPPLLIFNHPRPGPTRTPSQPVSTAFYSTASPRSGAAVAAVSVATSAAVVRVFGRVAESVAGAAARSAAFAHRQRSFVTAVGAPAPVSAGASADPAPVSGLTCFAVADISGPPSNCPCSERRGVRLAEGLSDGPR